MATQSRSGTRKRQAKGAGRAGASRRRAEATQRAGVAETGAGAEGGKPAAVTARRQGRATPPAEGEQSRASRKQQVPTASQGRFAGRTSGLRKMFDDTRTELRRVSWPDKETTQNLTLVVIAISIALGILLGGIDFVLFQIFEAIT